MCYSISNRTIERSPFKKQVRLQVMSDFFSSLVPKPQFCNFAILTQMAWLGIFLSSTIVPYSYAATGNQTLVRRVAPDWDLSDALPAEMRPCQNLTRFENWLFLFLTLVALFGIVMTKCKFLSYHDLLHHCDSWFVAWVLWKSNIAKSCLWNF